MILRRRLLLGALAAPAIIGRADAAQLMGRFPLPGERTSRYPNTQQDGLTNGKLGINTNNRFAGSLVAAFNLLDAYNPYEMISGQLGTIYGTVQPDRSLYGDITGTRFVQSSSARIEFAHRAEYNLVGAISIYALVWWAKGTTGGATFQQIIGKVGNGVNSFDTPYQFEIFNGNGFLRRESASADISNFVGGFDAYNAGWGARGYMVSAPANNASFSAFADGAVNDTATPSNAGSTATTNTNPVIVGCRGYNGGYNDFSDGSCALIYLFNTLFTRADYLELHADPFQLIQPDEQVPVTAAAPSATAARPRGLILQ